MKKIVCMLVLLLGFAVSASAAELKTPIIATTCGQTPGAMMLKMSAVQAKGYSCGAQQHTYSQGSCRQRL